MGAPKRVEMNLGWACNNDCVFCGEQERREHSRAVGMFRIPGEKVRADLVRYRQEGFDHVTFLGGEPTIRKDIVQLVRYARRLGYRNVFITSNGRMMSDRRFLRTLLRAGLTDVCISLHGPDAATHDRLTQRPGSFEQAEKSLLNLVLEGRTFHTSTVVTSHNAERLEDLVRYLHQYRPAHLYLALPNPSGGAYRDVAGIYPCFSEVSPHVRAAIAAARELGQLLTISKLPFCHLEGCEGYADDLYWANLYRRHIDAQVIDRIDQRFADRTAHPIRCGACRYRYLCEGVETFYLQRRGGDELVPVPGEPVRDPGELRATGPGDMTASSFVTTAARAPARGPSDGDGRPADRSE